MRSKPGAEEGESTRQQQHFVDDQAKSLQARDAGAVPLDVPTTEHARIASRR
jgi:hypothetical protein